MPVAVKIPAASSRWRASARRRSARARLHRRGQGRLRHHACRTCATSWTSSSRIETAAQLATQPIQYETGFTLLPGKYVIKFLARDAEAGRIGTYQTSFTIPNLIARRRGCRSAPSCSAASACRSARRSTPCRRRRGAEPVNPLDLRGREAAAERHPRVQHVTRHVRLPAGLRARRDRDAAARGVRDVLSGRREGVRDAAAAR